MPKTAKAIEPTITRDLTPERTDCPHCGRPMTADYTNRRTVHTLAGVTRLNLTIRRCHATTCVAHKKPYRPEAEGAVALPRHEFGLDVIALVGRLRYAEHRSTSSDARSRYPSGPSPTCSTGTTNSSPWSSPTTAG
jgi:hypothetical protein